MFLTRLGLFPNGSLGLFRSKSRPATRIKRMRIKKRKKTIFVMDIFLFFPEKKREGGGGKNKKQYRAS
jgi:hypothetical protein